jgi:geranylgeranyl pyrophosphate synthase
MGSSLLNSTLTFFSLVQSDIHDIEEKMRSQAQGYHPDIQAALDHLLSSGGKRIRPSLTMLIGKMLGGDRNRLITLAAAIELLHTATLVHDDLIDGSILRRGIPTINAQWSPAATVLTGDFLFARAAKLAADTNSIAVMSLFAKTLTIIVDGEVTQLFASRCLVDQDQYYKRIYSKTASLFETSTQAAAIIADADPEIVEAMRAYGYQIGMAFQIIDDILDYTSDPSTLGKPIGGDLRQGLVTLPAILYCSAHPEEPESKILMGNDCPDDKQITHLVQSVRQSDAIPAAHEEARKFVHRGLNAIRGLQPGETKSALEEIAHYIVDRDF